MIRKEVSQDGLILVTFELPGSVCARCISLVGEFNSWDTQATPLRHNHGNAPWKVTLVLEAGRRYHFRYLIDNQEWLNDWYADDHVENPFGSYDSVVDLSDFQRQPA